jgi:hypothetical protein
MIFGPLKPEAQSSIGGGCNRLKIALRWKWALAYYATQSGAVRVSITGA